MALRAAQEAGDSATELQNVPKGILQISALMSFGRLHLAPMIPAFLKQYPRIELHLTMSDRVAEIIAEGVDVAVARERKH
ncbi:MAG: LysR substrate-binding domain-containing protein [Cyanobacteria bacterium P01_C01_bin.121]